MLNLSANTQCAFRETGRAPVICIDSVESDEVFMISHPELVPGIHLQLTFGNTAHGMPPDYPENFRSLL